MRQHLVGAGTSLTQKIKDVMGCDECIAEYEDIKKSDRVNSAGRAAYVERNYWMIDESKYCIFYYVPNSNLIKEKNSAHCVFSKQSKSGTALGYEYALRNKNKREILIANN